MLELDNNSIQEIFNCFDAVEKVNVTTPYASKTWAAEVMKRDNLFLEQLGTELLFFGIYS